MSHLTIILTENHFFENKTHFGVFGRRSEAAKQIVIQNKKEEKEVNEFGKRGDINDDDCDEDEFRSFSDSDSDYDSPEEGLTQDQQGRLPSKVPAMML